MVSVVRTWGGQEALHDCLVSLLHFPPKKSEKSRLLEQQVLRIHRSSCRVGVHAGLLYNQDISPLEYIQRHLWVCYGCPGCSHFFCQCLLSNSRAGRSRGEWEIVFLVEEQRIVDMFFCLLLLVGSMWINSQTGGWFDGPCQCVSVSMNPNEATDNLKLKNIFYNSIVGMYWLLHLELWKILQVGY